VRLAVSLAFASATLISTMAQAQYTDGIVRIGVLSDMSSVYANLTGAGSVAAAKLAVQDFDPASHGMKVSRSSAPITRTSRTSARTLPANGSM
jgi:branched-chain amino acid transport system substrate-binding protein